MLNKLRDVKIDMRASLKKLKERPHHIAYSFLKLYHTLLKRFPIKFSPRIVSNLFALSGLYTFVPESTDENNDEFAKYMHGIFFCAQCDGGNEQNREFANGLYQQDSPVKATVRTVLHFDPKDISSLNSLSGVITPALLHAQTEYFYYGHFAGVYDATPLIPDPRNLMQLKNRINFKGIEDVLKYTEKREVKSIESMMKIAQDYKDDLIKMHNAVMNDFKEYGSKKLPRKHPLKVAVSLKNTLLALVSGAPMPSSSLTSLGIHAAPELDIELTMEKISEIASRQLRVLGTLSEKALRGEVFSESDLFKNPILVASLKNYFALLQTGSKYHALSISFAYHTNFEAKKQLTAFADCLDNN